MDIHSLLALIAEGLFNDVKMPDIGGLEIVANLKNNPELLIIMITAYSEIPLIKEAVENKSIEYYLTKPFDIDKVRDLENTLMKNNVYRL